MSDRGACYLRQFVDTQVIARMEAVVIDSDSIAEAQRALGRQLAAARRAAGFNQTGFAPLTGYSRSTIANVETGRQHVGQDFWERCDEVLGTDGKLACGYDDVETLRRERHEEAARQAEMARAAMLQERSRRTTPGPSRRGRPTKRRQALSIFGATFAHAIDTDILDALERAGGVRLRRRVDRKFVRAHQQLAETLAAQYRNGDPQVSLSPAMAYADSLLELLDADMSDSLRNELVSLAVGVHAQVGLWACHLHRSPLAYPYLATAREIAATVNDRPLQARAQGALSYLYSSAPRGGQGGQPKRALALLDGALKLAVKADPFTRGWLAIWRADQHVTLGNLAAARADMAAADRDLGVEDGGQVIGFFTRSNYGYAMKSHVSSVRGVVLGLEGRADESAHTFAQVQASAGNMRRRVASYGHQALTYVQRGQPEVACDALQQSVMLGAQEHYTMGIQRALGVRRRFTAEWSALPCVRQLDEQLRLLIA
jgi:DNA-binding XRE family transcriptional regulator